ncbi:sulfotransferase family cytosolic 1B member 1-like [Drosophila elegans]|uniref:sulfotransferase family cytosolic 1B member 1-like n=1 Tax=Drosophila elegans TaxID=30023 RepID=UPI0007E82771|nr:sulfotransferase family cytosolic 1B member 1-like [Drosophila elegans]
MYARRSIKSSASVPLIQVQCKGPNGSGPEWLPLKQDWSSRWCTLPDRFTEEFSQRIYDFNTRDSDVFLVTFMKSGTTWMQELAWLLLNNMNFEAAQSSYTMIRSPYLEKSAIYSDGVDYISLCNDIQTNPRFIKSHLPAQLLPPQFWKKGCKIIYLARNPKDVVVSSFHFLTGLDFWRGSLDEFVDDFVADKMAFTSYWAHVIDFYRMRNEENVFFVTYEEMSRNLKDVVQRLSRFLDCKELSESEMDKLLTHLNFKNMKGRKFGNSTGLLSTLRKTKDDFNFMRRGIVGSYKDELSPENRNKIDKLTERFLEEYGVTESEIFGSME